MEYGLYLSNFSKEYVRNDSAANGGYRFGLANVLRFEVRFVEIGRSKEIGNIDPQPLAKLMDHAQLHGIVGTIDDVSDGGLGHAALDI